ncbi:MAG: PDZ domain-containing protein [Planctomycetota bacterium]|jgi:hypothetical protein
MRALGFLLLLLLPLSAGETDALAQAVDGFRSDHAGEREAASQAVRRHLRAELAPLLAALESGDPEVSRRAREAIASLLPGPKKEEPEASSNVGGNVIVGLGGAAKQRFRFFFKQAGKGGQVVFLQGGDQKQTEALKKYGLEGQPVHDTLVRRQLQLAAGRGFAVTKVLPGTAAARIGLQAYDVVLSIGDRPVQELNRVLKALGKKETWGSLGMRILRAGSLVTLGKPRQASLPR